jgi:hypothetical protein
MISAQTLRVCREGKPLHTFPDHALMRILIATDAWHPQVNGVVRTLAMTAEAAKALGADVTFLTPQSFRTFALQLSGSAAGAALGCEDRPPDRRRAPQQHSYCDRRPDRHCGARLLPQA